MRRGPLVKLVADARDLAGEKAPVPLSIAWAPVAGAGEGDAAALRRRVGALLAELGRRMEETLGETLERASRAWDQVDALTVLDGDLRAEAASLRAEAASLRGPLAAEAALTIDAALALVTLLERRLATLARLRLRGEDADLLPSGRPFLDAGAALSAAARAWS